jgi:hypothetical protein
LGAKLVNPKFEKFGTGPKNCVFWIEWIKFSIFGKDLKKTVFFG